MKLVSRGSETPSKLMIRVKPSDPKSLQYYQETFKPRLEELLGSDADTSTWVIEYEELDPLEHIPARSRVKTLSVSAVLEYPQTTLLHASVLVEGNNQLHDN